MRAAALSPYRTKTNRSPLDWDKNKLHPWNFLWQIEKGVRPGAVAQLAMSSYFCNLDFYQVLKLTIGTSTSSLCPFYFILG